MAAPSHFRRLSTRSWRAARDFTVEVAGPACVVTAPWHIRPEFCALLNPANRELAGTQRPYFPRGGPLPPPPPPGLQASSVGWGGMDAGPNMLYPSQVVDGLTHMQAGKELRAALAAMPADADGERCAIGAAVLSEPFGLRERFDILIHTPPPFWPDSASDGWRQQLASCYTSSILALVEGARGDGPVAVASPLVGAGAAGAPAHAAAEVAADTLATLGQRELGRPVTVRLVLVEPAAREAVEAAIARHF